MPPQSLKSTNLFKPIKVGSVSLKHRLSFAPVSRFRADEFTPNDLMKKYYMDRATNNGGLLTMESVFASMAGGLLPNGLLICSQSQIDKFKFISDAIHKCGSFASFQIVHFGRLGHPAVLKAHGLPLIGPSAVYADKESENLAKKFGNELKEMTLEDIDTLKKDFLLSAKNAIELAKFDFVEIHAAHMSTLAQFIDINSNKRTDRYGGSIENRARLVLELVDLFIEEFGAEKVGIKFSPYVFSSGGSGADGSIHCIAQYSYIYSELERRAKDGKRLAYVHHLESRIPSFTEMTAPPPEYSSEWVSQIWKGILIRTGGYLSDPEYMSLIADVNANDRTIIGAGRYFTSNPDLPERLKNGYPLTEYDRSKFYSGGKEGYNDWKRYCEEEN
ncbi:unnamed protein product [Ambrosiozyma monospora]|uniref:Unnamed protein product n=1 Tax=Ambrosiozyma monospora TaxID=43982 RepID=A0A9W6YZ79_AMBMO|nr:unnamed protein product [Ambrosiozyma monospora]